MSSDFQKNTVQFRLFCHPESWLGLPVFDIPAGLCYNEIT